MMRQTLAFAALASGLLGPPALAQTEPSSANCAVITQAAADGAASRISADDSNIKPPSSVTKLSCLDGLFNGVGLDVITNFLNPTNLLASVEGKICAAVTQEWNNLIGSAQCGLTITGFDLGFGGLGGGGFCPKLSFGGGGPPIGTVGAGLGYGGGGGIVVNGSSLAPTGYTVPPNAGTY
jgi:hypothetical protein